jgi:hypothetical protein
VSERVEGAGENRQVPAAAVVGVRADACVSREGGSWGKQGFPHATEAQRREALA